MIALFKYLFSPQTRKGLSVDNESSSEVTLHSSHDVYNNSVYLDQAEGGVPPGQLPLAISKPAR